MPDDVNIRFRVQDHELDEAARKLKSLGPVGVEAGRTAGGGFSGMLGNISAVGFAIFGLQQSIGALKGAVGGLFSSNIQFEGFETSFKVLLGSADAAKARIADLSEFARATPFELPQVVQASQILETFTKGALSTGEGLRLVGDVAASTRQPINELAMWFGRLYDGLQSGRPVGEAMMRLQEIGAISGETRGRIEEMTKAGVDGNVVWATFEESLGRFSGQMEEQAKTVGGALSNINDGLGILKRNLMQGIFEAGKPLIMGLAEALGSRGLQKAANDAGVAIGKGFGSALTFVIELLRPMVPLVADVARELGGAFLRGLETLGDILGDVADGFMSVMNPARQFTTLTSGWAVLGAGIGTLADGLRDVWNGVRAIASDPAVQSAFGDLGEAIKDLITAVGSQLMKDAAAGIAALGAAFSALGAFLASSGTIQTIATIIESIASAIKKLADEHPEAVARSIEILVALFVGPAVVAGIMGFVGGLASLALGVATFPVKMLKDIIAPFDALKDKIFKPKIECDEQTTGCLDEMNQKLSKLQTLGGIITGVRYRISDLSETVALQGLIALDKMRDVVTEIKFKLVQEGGAITLPGFGAGGTEKIGGDISSGILSGMAKGFAQGAGAAIAALVVTLAAAAGGTVLLVIGVALAAAIVAALIIAFPNESGQVAGAIAGMLTVAIIGVPALIAVQIVAMTMFIAQTIADGLRASFAILKVVFGDLPAALMGSFKAAFGEFGGGAKDFAVGLITGDWRQAFEGALQSLRAIFVQLPMDIASDFGAAFLDIGGIIAGFVVDVGENMADAGGFILSFAESITGVDWSGLWDGARTAFGDMLDFVGQWLGEFIEGFAKGFADWSGLTDDEVNKVAGFIKDIPARVGDATEWLKEQASQMMGGFIGVVNDSWSYVRDSVWGMKDNVIGGLGDASGWLVDIGWAMMRGLAQSIYDGAEDVVKKALGWVKDRIPEWKGPIDEDAMLLYQTGRVIIGGLAKGTEDGATSILKPTLATITEAVFRDWRKTFDEMSGEFRTSASESLALLGQVIVNNMEAGRSLGDASLREMLHSFMVLINQSTMPDAMKFQASAMVSSFIDSLNAGKGIAAQAVLDFINFALAQAGISGVGGGAAAGTGIGASDATSQLIKGAVKTSLPNPSYAITIGGQLVLGSQGEIEAFLAKTYPGGVPQDVLNAALGGTGYLPSPTASSTNGGVTVQMTGDIYVKDAEEAKTVGGNIGYGLKTTQAAMGYM